MTDELRAARVAVIREAAAPAPALALKRVALEPLEVSVNLADQAGLAPIARGLGAVVRGFVVDGEEPGPAAALIGQESGLPVVQAAQAARVRELAAALAALAHAEARAKEELDASPAGPVRLGLEDAAAKALAPLLSAAGVSAAQVVDLTPPPQMAAPPPKVGSATAALGAKPAPKPVDVAIRLGARKPGGAKADALEPDAKADVAEAPRVELGGDDGLVLPYLVRAAVDHGRGALDDAGLVAVAKALAGLAQQGLLPKADDPRLLVTLAPVAARAFEETFRRASAKPKPGVPARDAVAPTLDEAALAAYGQALIDLVSPLRRALRPALEAARATPRRLVFAHGDDPRVVAAARQLADEGLATPWLLGDLFRLETRAKEQGTSLKGIRVIDPARDKRRGPYAAALLAASGTRGITPEDAARLVEEPVVFGALAVLQGEADALLLSDGHGDGLAPLGLASELLARREKVRGLAGTHVVSVAGRTLLVTDTSATSDPTCEEVADSALQAAALARTLLGVEPRVAFVSFTTHGAKGDPTIQRLGLARDLARVREPGLKVDGPLTADVALDPAVQAARLPACPLGGAANVLVVADCTAGALLVGALGTLAGAEAIGPLLGGLRQPATIAPRGATRADLVLLGALTVAQVVAQKPEESAERPALESGARGRTPQPGEVTRPSATFGPGAATATAVKPEVRTEPKSEATPRPSIRPAPEPKVEAAPKPEPAPAPKPAPKPMTLGQKPSDMGTPARTPPPPKPDSPPSRPLR